MPEAQNQPQSETGSFVVPREAASEDADSATGEAENELTSGSSPTPEDEAEWFKSARQRTVLKGLRQDIKARKRYARCIFRLIVWWLVSIFVMLLLQGFLSEAKIEVLWPPFCPLWKTKIGFRLSDPVLLALIGGTTANVLGLFFFVVQYLFPKRGSLTPPSN